MKANGENAVQKVDEIKGRKKALTVSDLVTSNNVIEAFKRTVGENAGTYVTSINNAVMTNPKLKECQPKTVIAAGLMAAALNLRVDSLGYAYILPYKDRKQGITVAQFQLGYKGLLQIAIRSGKYHKINVVEVYEDEFEYWDAFQEEIHLTDFKEHKQRREMDENKIIGYYAYFKTLAGYEKADFWFKEQVDKHGKKYSKTYNFSNGIWKTNFHAMAKKTVLKSLLNKWADLTGDPDLVKAIRADQSVGKNEEIVQDDGEIDFEEVEYVDAEIKEEK